MKSWLRFGQKLYISGFTSLDVVPEASHHLLQREAKPREAALCFQARGRSCPEFLLRAGPGEDGGVTGHPLCDKHLCWHLNESFQ